MTRASTGKPQIDSRFEGTMQVEAVVASSQLPRLLHVLRSTFDTEPDVMPCEAPHPILAQISFDEFYAHSDTLQGGVKGGQITDAWKTVVLHFKALGAESPVEYKSDSNELTGDLPLGLALLREQDHNTTGVKIITGILQQRSQELATLEEQMPVAINAVVTEEAQFS